MLIAIAECKGLRDYLCRRRGLALLYLMVMVMVDKDGGTAFPIVHSDGAGVQYFGMSLRDYFAAKAMQGLAAGLVGMNLENIEESIPVVAKLSIALAEAMLAERAK